eukprot:Amastigsp_a176275_33.p3 type:complete len:130 gc:universal Amastigsp_a176275_33:694-305(-)
MRRRVRAPWGTRPPPGTAYLYPRQRTRGRTTPSPRRLARAGAGGTWRPPRTTRGARCTRRACARPRGRTCRQRVAGRASRPSHGRALSRTDALRTAQRRTRGRWTHARPRLGTGLGPRAPGERRRESAA